MSLPSGLAEEDGLPAGIQLLGAGAAPTTRLRVGGALEALLLEQWGGPDPRPRAGASRPRPEGGLPMTTHDPDVLDYDEAVAAFDPVLGSRALELQTPRRRCSAAADDVRRRAETRWCARSASAAGALPVLNEKALESAIRIGLL
jgi:hypothetical protein